ncbi:hypothetical protein OIU74_024130 [Salix koriyanagi]|uniref:Uncharacterized protein n=1 Tax=Salix koriyanagi TaxID=2511006 RepID=A0A9Q0W9B8_9ROSI|nr:hypothetical protein OIU74_024130 [Salix koriyanagi]
MPGLTILPARPPNPSNGLLNATCPPPRTSYVSMPSTRMRTRWLTGKQLMHTRPQPCFRWKPSPAATRRWISAQFSLVPSLFCHWVVSSTLRRERERGLSEVKRAAEIVSDNKSI